METGWGCTKLPKLLETEGHPVGPKATASATALGPSLRQAIQARGLGVGQSPFWLRLSNGLLCAGQKAAVGCTGDLRPSTQMRDLYPGWPLRRGPHNSTSLVSRYRIPSFLPSKPLDEAWGQGGGGGGREGCTALSDPCNKEKVRGGAPNPVSLGLIRYLSFSPKPTL